MSNEKRQNDFSGLIRSGYTFEGSSLYLGGAMLDGIAVQDLPIHLPLATMNRHGLIAGATGTGKTKTLQVIAEGLSEAGVSSVLMDIKGDLSGIAVPGEGHPKIDDRHRLLGFPWEASGFPVEFYTLDDSDGVRLRSTITEFGPILFSRILDLNETQTGIMSLLFKYCDDNRLPLVDLSDLKSVLRYITGDGKDDIEREYGRVSGASVSAIMRKVIQIEQQGADLFLGEPSFDVSDFIRIDENGKGSVNVIRLMDVQDKPHMFSTFMLSVLDEIYESLPEAGDMDKPKLVLFIDEAHLIFRNATKTLMDQLEMMVKLIRSKGVGIMFCTQNPSDVPPVILSQLGLKIQHALRAFTARDRKNIRLTAENYPLTDFYDTKQLLTSLGIGEALVSALGRKGIPTPLVHVLLRAPRSRMGILSDEELTSITGSSELALKYNRAQDPESAHEILRGKMKKAEAEIVPEKKLKKPQRSNEPDFLDTSAGKQLSRSLIRIVERGILGGLKKLF